MDFELFKKINDERWNYGELEDASVVSSYRNTGCGDGYRIFLKIEDDIIADATYTTTGCGFGLVSLAMVTEWSKHKSLSAAKQVSAADIEEIFLFPPRRKNYPQSAAACLQKAVLDYENGTGLDPKKQVSGKIAWQLYERQGHLRDAQLRQVILSYYDFSGCDFTGADLSHAFMNNTCLVGAVLRNCKLRGTFLNNADLRDADLRAADLRWTKLTGSDLKNVRIDGALYDIGTRLDPKYLHLFANMIKKDERAMYLQKRATSSP